jgi:membrane-bound lytic murein transglycosylase A
MVVLLAAAGFGVWWTYFRAAPQEGPLKLTATGFEDIAGWQAADLSAALAAFRRSCVKILDAPPNAPMAYAGTAADWREACGNAFAARDARAFFEANFTPRAVGTADGLVTGYYEPLLSGSRARHGPFQTPVYGQPDDLITIDLGAFKPEWKGETISGRLDGRSFKPFPTRAQIDAKPPQKTRVLFWSDDPVSVFFLHIQGSGRVWLDDGAILRVTYAGQNGHPYTPIGRILIRKFGVPREGMSMQVIRAWLKDHPDDAQHVMESDASFVFFEEQPVGDPALGPQGSGGVALTPRASIAVDHKVHPFGVPVFITGGGIANLFIAQDTGGAIRGAARADIFFGFGASAEQTAGGMKANARFYVLLPKAITPKLPS